MSAPISDENLIEVSKNGDPVELEAMLDIREKQLSSTHSQEVTSLDQSLVNKLVVEAIRHGIQSTVHLLLEQFNSLSITDEMMRAALAAGSIEIYRELLTYDPEIIHLDIFEGRSSQLGYALSTPVSPSFVDFLLSCGVEPNPASPALHPLCLAVGRWHTQSIELVKILIRHGCKIGHSGALAAAAKYGRIDLVNVLLDKGADPNDIVLGSDGDQVWPALHAAIRNGNGTVANLLLSHGAYPQKLDENGRTAGVVAEAVGDHILARQDHGASQG